MRIHIFGASGSGVTTLGHALSERTGFPYFDSDNFYWEPSEPPFTIRRNPDQRNALIEAELSKPTNWILGGSVVSWGEAWLSAFDLAVFLWIPPAIRIDRLRKREFSRYGPVIFEDINRHQQYETFIRWASGYDDNSSGGSRTLTSHEAWMQKLNCPLLDIRGDFSVDERLNRVLDHVG